MFRLNDAKSIIYGKCILILQVILLLSIPLTQEFDDSIYEFIFRGLWFISGTLLLILLGTKEIFAKKNKVGYLYYIGAIIFISIIIYIYK